MLFLIVTIKSYSKLIKITQGSFTIPKHINDTVTEDFDCPLITIIIFLFKYYNYIFKLNFSQVSGII